MPKHVVISLMTKDRVGIIAAVAKAVYSLGGNIGAITQTVMDEFFTILLTADLAEAKSLEEIQKTLEGCGREQEFHVAVTERETSAVQQAAQEHSMDRFVLTVSGSNRRDIISRLSTYLAGRAINIIDLYAHTQGDKFLLIGQVVIPGDRDIIQVQIDLQGLWKDNTLRVTLQHEDIFAATNEIAFDKCKGKKGIGGSSTA